MFLLSKCLFYIKSLYLRSACFFYPGEDATVNKLDPYPLTYRLQLLERPAMDRIVRFILYSTHLTNL
jgi:hypothetical protein